MHSKKKHYLKLNSFISRFKTPELLKYRLYSDTTEILLKTLIETLGNSTKLNNTLNNQLKYFFPRTRIL